MKAPSFKYFGMPFFGPYSLKEMYCVDDLENPEGRHAYSRINNNEDKNFENLKDFKSLKACLKGSGIYLLHIIKKGKKKNIKKSYKPIKRIGGIDPKGVIYIGKTSRRLYDRVRDHIGEYYYKQSSPYQKNWIDKYSFDHIGFSVSSSKKYDEGKLLDKYAAQFLEYPVDNRGIPAKK